MYEGSVCETSSERQKKDDRVGNNTTIAGAHDRRVATRVAAAATPLLGWPPAHTPSDSRRHCRQRDSGHASGDTHPPPQSFRYISVRSDLTMYRHTRTFLVSPTEPPTPAASSASSRPCSMSRMLGR